MEDTQILNLLNFFDLKVLCAISNSMFNCSLYPQIGSCPIQLQGRYGEWFYWGNVHFGYSRFESGSHCLYGVYDTFVYLRIGSFTWREEVSWKKHFNCQSNIHRKSTKRFSPNSFLRFWPPRRDLATGFRQKSQVHTVHGRLRNLIIHQHQLGKRKEECH